MSFKKAGEDVFRVQPFAYVVAQNLKERVCDWCLVPAGFEKSFKKCSGCKVVYYCKIECQKKAWVGHHRDECQYLRRVTPKIPPDTVRLMARLICKLRQGGMREFAELPDGNFRYFEDLTTHQKNIVRDSNRIEAFMTYFAVLQDCLGDTLPPKPEVLDIFGRILINSFNIMNDDYQNIGIGLYLAPSVIDHSCAPNANIVFQGKTLILRTIENISDFKDIRIAYTNILASTEDRRKALKEQYYFECTCTKCQSGEKDDEKRSLICQNCQGCVPISNLVCQNCRQECCEERREKYLKVTEEFHKIVVQNTGGHPEPESQCDTFFSDMKAICHPFDKAFLDMLEILYEEWLTMENFEGCLEACQLILQHYHYHYPKYDINTGLMELKAAKLCTYLDLFDRAEKHLSIGKDILEITHGSSHPLMNTSVKSIKTDLDMGRREIKDLGRGVLSRQLKNQTNWTKSG